MDYTFSNTKYKNSHGLVINLIITNITFLYENVRSSLGSQITSLLIE